MSTEQDPISRTPDQGKPDEEALVEDWSTNPPRYYIRTTTYQETTKAEFLRRIRNI